MFSPAINTIEHNVYDFNSEENAPKWKGLFVQALQKVARQVYPSLSVHEDALSYIEDLILQLLGMLSASQPHGVQDVEDRVQKTFPHPIDKWATKDADKACKALRERKKNSPLVLPVDKIHPLLVKEVLGYKVEIQVTMYIVAVLEYIAADILKLTGNYVKNIKHSEITCQDIKVAMCADKVLMDMFFQDEDPSFNIEDEPSYIRRSSLTYEEIVKDLVLEETQYVRDLNMIIKVFRQPFVRLFPRSKDLEVIFSNINDVHEFTVRLLSNLEDTLEMAVDDTKPLVGGCFEELAEGAEFDVYEKYADDMLKPNGRERLNTLLQRSDVLRTFTSYGPRFNEAAKYVLPKLLLGPIYHCLHYFDVIKALIDTTECEEDKESLIQTHGVLNQLKVGIERKLGPTMQKRKTGELSLRFQGRGDRESAVAKLRELQKNVDGWEPKDMGQGCNKFIMEGTLYKFAGKRITERYVFLFDAMIILTKQNTKRSSVTGPVGDYKLKEKYNLRKADILDRDDVEEVRNVFELSIPDVVSITFVAKSLEDKNNWMAALVSLFTRSTIERILDGILVVEEKQQPLRLPSPECYKFAEKDSEENIVFEDNQDPNVESPLIKGGTLIKLVERLTYHMYADPKFVQTFLTTYRSFCKPEELLELLIQRFHMPEPSMTEIHPEDVDIFGVVRDDLKRFRREYCKPIQIRVLNVVRHWIDQHWYDFERNRDLLEQLRQFLDTVKGKPMRKCVESIHNAIHRRLESPKSERQITLGKHPPQIEWHITRRIEDYDLMTLHPVEIARQVTLLEFDLYRAVKPSELVGSVWIKKEKSITSPNLLKMIHHSTMFTFWLEKCIIEAENFEERVAVVSRILEIMLVFQSLNNFNGVLEVVSALNSAPVFRLRHTFEELEKRNHKLMKAFDEAKDLNSDHYKQYIEKLRSIDPPCVPFLGMYLTNILLTEEGNPDFLPNRPQRIINFSKRRKVAEITQEIQQYQNQPYCLQMESDIRNFFESLDPLEEKTEKEFGDYLYGKSLEIEPRNSKAPIKFESRRKYNLKSPGVKQIRQGSVSTIRVEKSHPSSLAIMTAPSTPTCSHNPGEVEVEPAPSSGVTPPTPSPPSTPHYDGGDGNIVFMPVLIPKPAAGSSSASPQANPSPVPIGNLPPPPPTPDRSGPTMPGPPVLKPLSAATHATSQITSQSVDQPPPLPPRNQKPTTSKPREHSPVLQASDAPKLPPRDTTAPPVPPRREVPQQTLPRTQSMTIQRQPPNVTSTTLPRRNSERDHVTLNVNGERGESDTPELPPKTYRVTHARKQSS